MDAVRYYMLCFACVALAASGFTFGAKLMKKRNYLLALEWIIVATSSSNFLVYFLTESPVLFKVAHFFDAFSRGFGMPIVGIAGLMAATHDYKPSIRQDVALFGISIVGTVVLVAVDSVAPALPYFYVVMWTLLSIYLAYMVKKLLDAGEGFLALTTTVALLAGQGIASIYDFYKIPGDEHNLVFNFFFLALMTWAYCLASLYYAYCALERIHNEKQALNRPALYRN